MKKYYPINLDINGKRCLVVGGGRVAERKIKKLLEQDASVCVIGPDVTSRIKKLQEEKKIRLFQRRFRSSDITYKTFLVIGATDNPKLNFRISSLAKKQGKLVNIIDSPTLSNFIVPASISRDPLTISISTAGASPAMAKKIRKELKSFYGREYGIFLEWMQLAREIIINRIPSQKKRQRVFEKLIDSPVINLLKKGKKKEAKKTFKRLLSKLI